MLLSNWQKIIYLINRQDAKSAKEEGKKIGTLAALKGVRKGILLFVQSAMTKDCKIIFWPHMNGLKDTGELCRI
jgi:hypothetical protein